MVGPRWVPENWWWVRGECVLLHQQEVQQLLLLCCHQSGMPAVLSGAHGGVCGGAHTTLGATRPPAPGQSTHRTGAPLCHFRSACMAMALPALFTTPTPHRTVHEYCVSCSADPDPGHSHSACMAMVLSPPYHTTPHHTTTHHTTPRMSSVVLAARTPDPGPRPGQRARCQPTVKGGARC